MPPRPPSPSPTCGSAGSTCPTWSTWSTSAAPTSWRTATRRRSTGSRWTVSPTRRSSPGTPWNCCAPPSRSATPRGSTEAGRPPPARPPRGHDDALRAASGAGRRASYCPGAGPAGPGSERKPAHAAELDPLVGQLTGRHLRVRTPGGDLHQSRLQDLQPLEVALDVLRLADPAPVALRRPVHEVRDEVTDLGVLADQLAHHHEAARRQPFAHPAGQRERAVGVAVRDAVERRVEQHARRLGEVDQALG